MDTTTSVVATAAVVTVGEWSKPDKRFGIKRVVGFMMLAILLAAMEAANQKFARQFAALLLVGALFTYAIPISKKLGFTK